MRIITSSALTVVLFLVWGSTLRAQDDLRAVIARAVQAHGGEDKLLQFKAEQVMARGTIQLGGDTISFTAETFVQLPNQFKNILRFMGKDRKGVLIQVLDGDKGWIRLDDQTTPFTDQLLAETKETMYLHRISRLTNLLRDNSFKLAALGESKINNLTVIGIKVSSAGHKDVHLYFDKTSGLLVKTERRALDSASKKEVLQEEFFSDFKEVNGIRRPMKIVVHQDGKKFMEGEMIDLKQVEKLDDSVFAKP